MTTKDYLKQIIRYDRIINNKLSEIYQLKSLVSSISVAINDDKVQTSGSKDKLGDTIAKIYDLEREVDAIIDGFFEKKKHIISQIEGIVREIPTDKGMDYYDVLTARFVKCLDFDDIPDEVNMSRSKVFYIYSEALTEFEKLYGEEYLN